MKMILKKQTAFVLLAVLCLSLTAGCGSKDGTQTTDTAVQTDTTETQTSGEATKPDELKSDEQSGSPADAIVGEWEMIYNRYTSEYGTEDTYEYINMCEDEYGNHSQVKIRKEGGNFIADYRFEGYESMDRFYGIGLEYADEPAYEGCENQDWSLSFIDPFGDDNSLNGRFTLIDGDTMEVVFENSEGNKGDEDYYHYISTNVYLRKDNPRLADKESLRYFETVTVSNAEELLNNIKNNTKIILEAGTYDITTVDESAIKNENVIPYEYSYGAYTVQNVSNFCIEAKDGANVLICVDDAYDPVMRFEAVSNVTLRGLTVGHNVEPGYCSGSVLEFASSSGISIDKCGMFGCGTYGIAAYSSGNINVTDSEIYECTYGLLDMSNVYNARFENTIFRDSKELSMICANECYEIYFDNCQFKNNTVDWDGSYFVELSEYTDMTFTDCSFENNQYDKFANRRVKQVNCKISDNGDPDMSNIDSTEEFDPASFISSYDDVQKRQDEIDAEIQKGTLDQTSLNNLAYEEYTIWDTLLNNIWGYLRITVPEEDMEVLTEDQKKWIKEKEAAVRAAGADFEGGSMQSMMENDTGAAQTKKRVDYLMDKYIRTK